MTSDKEIKINFDTEVDGAMASDTDNQENAAKEKRFSRKKLSPSEKQIQKLEEKIAVLEAEIGVLIQAKILAEDKMKRVVADFDNMTKRKEREYDRTLSFARENLVRDLLPLLDDLERSVQFETHKENDDVSEEAENGSHQVGIRMIYDHFLKYLQDAGVQRFDPTGEDFDPDKHDAMLTRPAQDGKSGIVLETFQPGYKLGERILRHAKVIVSE